MLDTLPEAFGEPAHCAAPHAMPPQPAFHIALRCGGNNIGPEKRLLHEGSAAIRSHAAPAGRPATRALTLPGAGRQRADVLLTERGLVESRTRAQAVILAGKVYSGERRVAKAGDLLALDAALEIRGQDHPWVSRGGLKLDHALATFGLRPAGLVCLDVGASTGGFTDVLLSRGAVRVHAVDVGHGQLAWKLRSDPRVVVHEKTNARHLTPAAIGEEVGALVCDASFIGLRTLLPAPLALCAAGAWAVALLKPQFEAGPGQVGGKGGVRAPAVHASVCQAVQDWWHALAGWQVVGVTPSPITGPEGNREFLIAARRNGGQGSLTRL